LILNDLTLLYPGGQNLKHIDRFWYFLTFPKYGLFELNFLLGVALSGTLENVEIYISKIDTNNFLVLTLFIAESFYTKKLRMFAKN